MQRKPPERALTQRKDAVKTAQSCSALMHGCDSDLWKAGLGRVVTTSMYAL